MPPNNFLKDQQSRRKAPLRKAVSCIDPPSLEVLNKRKDSTARRHSKVEVVSCFRSSGTVTLPKPKVNPPLPPKPPTLPDTSFAEILSDSCIILEEVKELCRDNPPEGVQALLRSQKPSPQSLCTGEILPQVKVEVMKPKPRENFCSKHTKCHCDLFSKDLDSFFGIEIKQRNANAST
eukprot:TRINITY_DN5168_c0_g1_i1.p1 TRINITY_DN5168_c0_g1~~TRINITY_DN5168_c0_g1_i1.p1  ORF type:complete len:178 (-),score=54.78 TRINITY_DN5168_c0_g1_i1:97-630(-)